MVYQAFLAVKEGKAGGPEKTLVLRPSVQQSLLRRIVKIVVCELPASVSALECLFSLLLSVLSSQPTLLVLSPPDYVPSLDLLSLHFPLLANPRSLL
jgi:hypothetical protein